MNKLYIIGNGFDLAHGLNTRYTDFILWYLNKSIKTAGEKIFYEDNLIKISTRGHFKIPPFDSTNEILRFTKANGIEFKIKHSFLRNIIEHTSEFNWVDIESKYYSMILSSYSNFEKGTFNNKELIDLNTCFNELKELLIEYLNTIEILPTIKKTEISNHFKNELKTKEIRMTKETILFLNFNYTSTIELYMNRDSSVIYELNYIHGKLNDKNNPIIFGYGDEMDSYYEKIERLNNNDFLKYFKSFSYFKTNNYQKFTRFIESEPFQVFIMGHSCGLSDRILLNSIFEHENCKSIKIYYHQKDNIENDFYEKTQEISRHFKANFKNKMRNIIVPYNESLPLVKI